MNKLPSGAHVRDGRLLLGDHEISALVARAGQTPCYAYLRATVTQQVRLLREKLPPAAQIFYSPKANPMPALIHHLSALVDGFDLASHGEMRRVLDAGVPAASCLLTGPGKSLDDIHGAVAAGVVVNVESSGQVDQVAAAGKTFSQRPVVSLRLNAAFGQGGPHGHRINQFGVDPADAHALIERIHRLGLRLRGIHVFWGSQHTDPQGAAWAQQRAFQLASQAAAHAPGPLAFINVGGGFPLQFYADDSAFDVDAACAAIRAWAAAEPREPDCRLTFEFGRFIVGSAGFYITRVLDRKVVAGETFVVTDGGLHQHLLASSAFGRSESRNAVVLPASWNESATPERVTVVGRLCSTMDRVASGILLPPIAPGDYLVIPNSGAYGPTFSARDFLSHPAAVEMLI